MFAEIENDNPFFVDPSPANVENNRLVRRFEFARSQAIREIREQNASGQFSAIRTAIMLWWKTDKLTDQKLAHAVSLDDLVNNQVAIIVSTITEGSSSGRI